MPHDPEVDDAPVGAWEALKDFPSINAVAVNHIGVGSRYGKGPGVEIGRFPRRFFGGPGGRTLSGRLPKGAPLRSQTLPSSPRSGPVDLSPDTPPDRSFSCDPPSPRPPTPTST